jgi:uncharacterized phiE125 gp8 family phage protein
MMDLVVITPPVGLPVTVGQLKQFIGMTTSDIDAVVEECLRYAVELVESSLGVHGINRVVEMRLDGWPMGREIRLSGHPVTSLTSVTYLSQGSLVTLPSTHYTFDSQSAGPARVVLKDGLAWPAADREPAAVRLRYTVGFGADATAIPVDLLLAYKEIAHRVLDGRGQIEANALRQRAIELAPNLKQWGWAA